MYNFLICIYGRGGRVRGCGEGVVSCVSGSFNWYWLTIGQGLQHLLLVRVEGGGVLFCFLLSFLFFLSLFHLYFFSLFLADDTVTHKSWCVKPNTNLHLRWTTGLGARSDSRRLEVTGSTPPRPASFFCEGWPRNIFYCHSLPSADSRRKGICQFLAKGCAQ